MARNGYTVDGVRVAQARAGRGLTQAQAADELGVNRVTLNKIENGHARVSLDLLERMSGHYAVGREWLLGEEEPVDAIEQGREQVAVALQKISQGFEELGAILTDRVRDAKSAARDEVHA